MKKATLTLSAEALAFLKNVCGGINSAPGGAPLITIARELIEVDTAVTAAMAAITQENTDA